MKNFLGHSFHIPVLGIGYSVDTPLKVAKYGISSVVSLVDDMLMEQLRKKICADNNEEYIQINAGEEDSRAKRITAYLNLLNMRVKKQFEELKSSAFELEEGIKKYLDMLPDYSELKKKYKEWLSQKDVQIKDSLEKWIRSHLHPGSIDVNIMTKLDKENYGAGGTALPAEFNDAHSALRGFAMSDLESSIVFSAGMNPRLFSYAETFKDFFPDKNGKFKKKITVKVSDFRSALIQGKYLAKKGLWVNEFRIESGLNCGGHAFATDGYLMGPILEEFKNRKNELVDMFKELLHPALNKKEIETDYDELKIKVSVQGGVGNESEQMFLLDKYDVDSVGWGSPFLLVPEAVNIDDFTLHKLCDAGENDLYLSNISPLGVPFNSLRGNSKDIEKQNRIEAGKPGSPCAKKYLLSKRDFVNKLSCNASITYLKEINRLKESADDKENFAKEYNSSLEKACLCEGLSASALISNEIVSNKQSMAVSVCPGPNIAYFSQVATLKEMIDHIYGRINLITDDHRPNLFMKELDLYLDYLNDKIKDKVDSCSKQAEEYLITFKKNIAEGIAYYKSLMPDFALETGKAKEKIRLELEALEQKFYSLFASEISLCAE